MPKTNNQINKEAHNSDVDSPAVIAYRLGQVENAVRVGFQDHNKKLDDLTSNFVTKEEFNGVLKDIGELKAHRFQTNWLFPTLAAAAGATVAILVSIALNK